MRIIAGQLGGRHFKAPTGHRTHPMSDRVRGGLFNSLGDVTGLSVFDGFAGSGALSFEALSRGAASALALDKDKQAVMTMKTNCKELKLDSEMTIICINNNTWSNLNPDECFDLVLLDPPYDAIQPQLLEKLAHHTKKNGSLVLSLPTKDAITLSLPTFKVLATKNYGDAQLVFYRQTG